MCESGVVVASERIQQAGELARGCSRTEREDRAETISSRRPCGLTVLSRHHPHHYTTGTALIVSRLPATRRSRSTRQQSPSNEHERPRPLRSDDTQLGVASRERNGRTPAVGYEGVTGVGFDGSDGRGSRRGVAAPGWIHVETKEVGGQPARRVQRAATTGYVL